jgi:hypothetical protein
MLIFLPYIAVAILAWNNLPGQGNTITPYCPQTVVLSGSPVTDYWFAGTIAQMQVRMYLHREGDGVVGLYYNEADWTRFSFGGQVRKDGGIHISLAANNRISSAGGKIDGRLTSGGLVGAWQSGHATGTPRAVNLTRTSEPSCDGRGEWRRYSSPSWPISFAYPSSWHLEPRKPVDSDVTEGEAVILECPDPKSLAYGLALQFSKEIQRGRSVSDFVACGGDEWKYGDGCDCENSQFCRTPRIERRADITIFQADQIEYRMYCQDGGYVGQGEGHRFMLSLDNKWIQFYGIGLPSPVMERILQSTRAR